MQSARLSAGHLGADVVADDRGGEHVHVGDVVATRRNDRALITSAGEPVRNRETWTVTGMGTDGSLTVSREQGHGTVANRCGSGKSMAESRPAGIAVGPLAGESR